MKPRERSPVASADRRRARRHRRLVPRGQATVEYSLVAHFILMGGGASLIAIMPRLFEALNTYLNSIYFVIQTGAV